MNTQAATAQVSNTTFLPRRKEPRDSLDLFRTPAWATHKLFDHMPDVSDRSYLDPCAGLGDMSEVLNTYFRRGLTADIHDYGYPLDHVGDFLVRPNDAYGEVDWVVMNPPFNRILPFTHHALTIGRHGVALLGRVQLLEGLRRYDELWSVSPPTKVCMFVERLAFMRGLDQTPAPSIIMFAWFIWDFNVVDTPTTIEWIRPRAYDDADSSLFAPNGD